MAHVEDVPELYKGQCQECYRHGLPGIQVQPQTRCRKAAEHASSHPHTLQYYRNPLWAAQDRLLRIARRPLENIAIAFAHGEREGREYIGDKVQVQDLQWQDR